VKNSLNDHATTSGNELVNLAALKSLSTAAELGSVELISVKATARERYDSIGCQRSSA